MIIRANTPQEAVEAIVEWLEEREQLTMTLGSSIVFEAAAAAYLRTATELRAATIEPKEPT